MSSLTRGFSLYTLTKGSATREVRGLVTPGARTIAGSATGHAPATCEVRGLVIAGARTIAGSATGYAPATREVRGLVTLGARTIAVRLRS